MSSLRRALNQIGQSRRLLRALDRIAVAAERQADTLDRIALAVGAGPVVEASEADLRQTSVSVSQDYEQVLLQAVAERIYRDTGHQPTDEELAEALDAIPAPARRG